MVAKAQKPLHTMGWLSSMASPRGFEPPTYSLGNRCSILLSYGDRFSVVHSPL